MPFISVVPAIRTPFGVDVFDYRVADESDVAIGDLIRVPFRKRVLPALIIRIGTESAYANLAMSVEAQPLLRLGSDSAKLLAETSRHTFCSQPTVSLPGFETFRSEQKRRNSKNKQIPRLRRTPLGMTRRCIRQQESKLSSNKRVQQKDAY
jgi:hypothetical protein